MSDPMRTIWEATIDSGAFRAEVTSEEDPYAGTLRVTHVESEEELLAEPVTISYGAPFGPDVADVAAWQDRALEVVDAFIAREG